MLYPEWVHHIREHEIDNLDAIFRKYLIKNKKKNLKILEIGAGDGHMSSLLINKGWNIIATDPKPRTPMKTNVIKMNVFNLSYDSNSFEIIFSSNVLEHIQNLPLALAEMKRVLKKKGIMVHTVPTVPIIIFTFVINPIAYFRNIILALQGIVALRIVNPLNFIYTKGHGISKTAFHAIFKWRKKKWKKVFKDINIKIIYSYRLNLAYSLHKTFPFKFMKLRHLLGRSLGSADIYVLQKQ